MTKRATASWVPASNVVFLLCFVKLLASSSQDARSHARGSAVCNSEGSGGSLLSGKVCNREHRQCLQIPKDSQPIPVSSWSLPPVLCILIFYHFSCLTCCLFPAISSYLTPVAVKYLPCSSWRLGGCSISRKNCKCTCTVKQQALRKIAMVWSCALVQPPTLFSS